MSVQIRVPQMGESVTEGVIAQWLKKVGDSVAADEPVVEVETDKITVEVPAPSAGVLTKQMVAAGATVAVNDIVGEIDPAGAGKEPRPEPERAAKPPEPTGATEPPRVAEPVRPAEPARAGEPGRAAGREVVAVPSARREAAEVGVDLATVEGSGRGGTIRKEDVVRARSETRAPAPTPTPVPPPAPRPAGSRQDERKLMSPIRRRVAARLVQSQQSTATLTTFNEVDMSAVMELRKRYQDDFVAKHGVKIGFMSFFVKAAVEALRAFPEVNAEIDGDDVVYHHYYDIGVAVGGGKGLVVPVLRDVDRQSFAEIEQRIADFGARAKANKLTLEDLAGGTFTVSNGGVYGSMLSTPILNPPQTGILGLHNIVERPVVRGGQVVIRPVMYVALSYDHRLIDGREAVQFLVRIKQCIEDPERMLLEV
jgi:2-oxoglutarate dehydrogenase E2 component (dihydrolipoamide succinyltransferase)